MTWLPVMTTKAQIANMAAIVSAYLGRNQVVASEIPNIIQAVYGAITEVGQAAEAHSHPDALVPAVPVRRSIGEDIKTVQFGWPLGMPLVRKMEPGLWEVRCDIADGIARVLFTAKAGQMVLLHGFVKKTQKTPDNELKTARNRLKKL